MSNFTGSLALLMRGKKGGFKGVSEVSVRQRSSFSEFNDSDSDDPSRAQGIQK
jgi:hypothetical protein